MADITLTGVERDGDKLKLTGTGFTKTTTTVYAGSERVPFEWISDTEITIDSVSRGPITVEKGGITSAARSVPSATAAPATGEAGAPEGHTADTSTTAEGTDEMSDVTVGEMNAGVANAAIETPQNPKTEVTPERPGEHVPYQNFREAVHQSPVTRVEEDLGIGVRDPYPTGNPRPQEDIDAEVHGVVPRGGSHNG